MTWVRSEDGMPLHPKILRLSDGAFRLWENGLHFANRVATNGHIEKVFVPSLNHHGRWTPEQIAGFVAELVRELWVEDGEHYRIHDYEHHQAEALKDRVERKKEFARERQRRKREKALDSERESLGLSRRDDHRDDPREFSVPSRPVPSRTYVESGDVSPPLLLTSGDPEKPKRTKAPKPSRHDQAMADPRVVEALGFYRDLHGKDHRWKPETKEGPRTRAEHILCALNGDDRDEMILDEVKAAIRGNHADRWHADISKHELSYVLRADKAAAFAVAGQALAPRQGVQTATGDTSRISDIESRLRTARARKDAVAGTDDAKAAMAIVQAIQLELARANERRSA